MKKLLMKFVAAQSLAAMADHVVNEDVTLSADTDWSGDGKVASAATPRRGSLLYKKILIMIATAAMLPLGVLAAASTPPSTLVDLTTNGSNPSGSVASSSDYSNTYNANQYNGTKAFDGITNTKSENRWLPKKAANMWVVYTFNTATVVDSILVKLPGIGYSASVRAPRDWTFQGSNDKSAWAVLDTQTGETDWSDNESRYYKFSNTTAYKYYKFNCTDNNGDANCMQVLELEFYCVGGANSTWTGGGTTDLLSDVANWGGSAMPGSEYAAYINDTGATPAAVPGGLTVYNTLWVGSGASAKVVQTNGTVVTRGATIGREGGDGRVLHFRRRVHCDKYNHLHKREKRKRYRHP